uniref:Aspartate-semialdehyde dehydrogenase n=1 Tax=Chromera velia CCMP2878 TaxID=1169474 RepID=A0A0G4GBE9_9ALVE|mmetsp:Transcript_37302/g.73392  ORF Transcript_37302/g.73392 Transcript_37302/m.73392 type:complete len:366 (+) Transcript_37302:205-1302(+)|eukprot:Cvel_4475.t1-p1 / transcript=Cvel_4475.t1 / gene=Cvel_4475 / organism=Chromera_velia_CCMP2878 / gene_product=Aspartate-semialdehyde dehydrogenase, putative / transcript_product=Aspartate-semialdehyde dehydrogenase, putative / location=Cvel_scaffold195:109125-115410(-) / protein_length=365 / sequence_SO=supercontig / SO=protein_coding / is_pseudo=false
MPVAAISSKYRVGILGATGAVGQRFLQLLEGHPWFEVTALGASERNAGKTYKDAANWKISADIPEMAKGLVILDCSDTQAFLPLVDLLFSGLDSSVAGTVEKSFAEAGVPVFSNAKNYRMAEKVPILLPTANPDHVDIVTHQDTFSKGGFIVTNANCSSTGLTIALKPIFEAFGITTFIATTLQAISGAGYPGLSAMDMTDNCVPFISGEEDKIETEPCKILGKPKGDGTIQFASMKGCAMCHRVAVSDGHVVSVSLKLENPPSGDKAAAVVEALRKYRVHPDVEVLPSCPPQAVVVRDEPDRPQPRLDRMAGGGQASVVGRVRECPVFDVRMVTLSHNTIVGAAGGSLLNAELAVKRGYVKHRQ